MKNTSRNLNQQIIKIIQIVYLQTTKDDDNLFKKLN